MAAAIGKYQQVINNLITPSNQAVGVFSAGMAIYIPLVIKTYGPGLIAGEFGRNYGLLGYVVAPLFTPAAVEMMADPATVFSVTVIVIKGGCLVAPLVPSVCSKAMSVSYSILSNIPSVCSSVWTVCSPIVQSGGSKFLDFGSRSIRFCTSLCRNPLPPQ